MSRGDAKDMFLRKLRLSGLDKYGAKAIADRLDALEAGGSAASGLSAVLDVTWSTDVASQDVGVFASGAAQAVQSINTTPDIASGVTVSSGVAHVAASGLYVVMMEVTATSFDSTGGDPSNATVAHHLSFWTGDGTDLSHQEELVVNLGFAAGGIVYPGTFISSFHATREPLVAWVDSAYSIGYRCGWVSEDGVSGHVMTETKRLRMWKLA